MLAILAFVVLVSQTVRHAYLLSQPGLEEMYAARPVLAERRDAGLVKLARTMLLKRFGAKRQIMGNVCREARARRAA